MAYIKQKYTSKNTHKNPQTSTSMFLNEFYDNGPSNIQFI